MVEASATRASRAAFRPRAEGEDADEDADDAPITEKSPLRPRDEEGDKTGRRRARRARPPEEEGTEMAPLPAPPEAPAVADNSATTPVKAARRRRRKGAEDEDGAVAESGAAAAAAGHEGGGSLSQPASPTKRAGLITRMRRPKGGSDGSAGDEGGEGGGGASSRPAPSEAVEDLTERPAPTFVPTSKRAKAEAAIYTTARPRMLSLARRRQTGLGAGGTALEDGLYVAPMPAVPATALRILEARLGFAPASKALADEGGTLLRQPDPVRHVRVFPSWLNAADSSLLGSFETERKRPQRWGAAAGEALGPGGAPHVLQVSIGGMQLHDHPLFLREHALQRELRCLAMQLADARERQQTALYALKISELKAATAALGEQIGGRKDADGATTLRARLSALTVELLETRQLKDEQECAERLLSRRLLALWRQLKAERASQRFRATRARVQFQLLEPSPEQEAAALETELEEELEERRLAHSLAFEGAGGAGEAFSEAETRRQVARRQAELRKPPSEEEVLPVYTESASPTAPDELPGRERSRQLSAAGKTLYALLLVDGCVACELGAARVHPHDFCLRFDRSVQLQLLTRPARLSLQVWQRRLGGLADRLLSEVFLAVPETASAAMPQWRHYAFADARTFTPLRERGSDRRDLPHGAGAALDGVAPLAHHVLSGEIEVSTAWTTRPADRLLPDGRADGAVPERGRALDLQHVWSSVMAEELDPNAPQDVPLLSLLAHADSSSVAGMFRALRTQAALQWSATWAPSDRYSLFQVRRKQPGKWAKLPDGERAVPPLDSQIPSAMRELLRPQAEFDEAVDRFDVDRAALERAVRVKAWIAQVRSRHEAAKASQRYVMDLHDYVREPLLEVEAAELNCDSLLRLLEPRRKLLPRRHARKAVPGSNETPRQIEVVVQSGVDLPVRAGAQPGAPPGAPRPRSRLFVEVKFQEKRYVTDVKAGANPIWNTILELTMRAPGGDWSQQAIMNLPDEIAFNLFDRVSRTERHDRDDAQVTTREETRWLGGFSLPFSTLYRNGKLEGSFPLSTMPPVLLGYEKDVESRSRALVPSSSLRLFLTINPLLPLPKEEERERLSARDAEMQAFAKGWLKSVGRDDRHLRVFVPGADGEKALLCRFVRPQNPPDELRSSAEQLLRFVSLVPFLDDAALDGGALDVWNTSDSFLDLGAGDQEEHALLLCNYLLALSRDAYVVLGSGIPEGLTTYVLTLDGARPRLWNACSGRSWSSEEFDQCSLTSVGAVFNDKNIWANVGGGATPKEVTWNLYDEKAWRPFFGKGGFRAPDFVQSLQKDALEYRRTTEKFRSGIERELLDALQRDVEEQRDFRPTDWNRSVTAKLKELLKRFEQDASGAKKLTAAEHDAALERVRSTYNMVGLPINVTYTDRSAIIKRVRETNIFMAVANKIEFALAVYAHSYPNKVCSVWVYCASLEDMRTGKKG